MSSARNRLCDLSPWRLLLTAFLHHGFNLL
jgi:hypothetical protein